MKLQLSLIRSQSWEQKFTSSLLNRKTPVDSFLTRIQQRARDLFSLSGPRLSGSAQELQSLSTKLVHSLNRPQATLLTCNAELIRLVSSLKKAIAEQGTPLSLVEQGQVLKALIGKTPGLSKEKQQEVFRTVDELYQIGFFDKHKEKLPVLLAAVGTIAASASALYAYTLFSKQTLPSEPEGICQAPRTECPIPRMFDLINTVHQTPEIKENLNSNSADLFQEKIVSILTPKIFPSSNSSHKPASIDKNGNCPAPALPIEDTAAQIISMIASPQNLPKCNTSERPIAINQEGNCQAAPEKSPSYFNNLFTWFSSFSKNDKQSLNETRTIETLPARIFPSSNSSQKPAQIDPNGFSIDPRIKEETPKGTLSALKRGNTTVSISKSEKPNQHIISSLPEPFFTWKKIEELRSVPSKALTLWKNSSLDLGLKGPSALSKSNTEPTIEAQPSLKDRMEHISPIMEVLIGGIGIGLSVLALKRFLSYKLWASEQPSPIRWKRRWFQGAPAEDKTPRRSTQPQEATTRRGNGVFYSPIRKTRFATGLINPFYSRLSSMIKDFFTYEVTNPDLKINSHSNSPSKRKKLENATSHPQRELDIQKIVWVTTMALMAYSIWPASKSSSQQA